MEWTTVHAMAKFEPIDLEVLEESALAGAQAIIYKAMKESDIKRTKLAQEMNRPRSFITRMLSGSHNLTIKTFARAMAACGYELRFEKRPIRWGWVAESTHVVPARHRVPASAGTPMFTETAGIGVPAGGDLALAAVLHALIEHKGHGLELVA